MGAVGVAVSADGTVWFAGTGGSATRPRGAVGHLNASGRPSVFYTSIVDPSYIAQGPDGAMWFIGSGDRIGRVTAAGAITTFDSGVDDMTGLTAGPDRKVWFAGHAPATSGGSAVPAIGAIATSGHVTIFTRGLAPGGVPTSIVAGADGDLWFTDPHGLGRLASTGAMIESRAGLQRASAPSAVAAGAGGTLWFTDDAIQPSGRPAIGRIDP